MTDEQLREAVARLLNASCFEGCEPGDDELRACTFLPCRCRTTADAAIALMRPVIRAAALEEAARVVRRMPSPSSEWMADELLRALGGHANPIPAAIRALKEKPNG